MEMHKMQVSKSPSQKALYTAYLLGKGWEPIMEGLIQSSLLYCGMYIYLLPKWFRKKEKKKRHRSMRHCALVSIRFNAWSFPPFLFLPPWQCMSVSAIDATFVSTHSVMHGTWFNIFQDFTSLISQVSLSHGKKTCWYGKHHSCQSLRWHSSSKSI